MEDHWELENETFLNGATTILYPNGPIVTATTK